MAKEVGSGPGVPLDQAAKEAEKKGELDNDPYDDSGNLALNQMMAKYGKNVFDRPVDGPSMSDPI